MLKRYTFTTPYKDAYEIVDRDIDKAMKPEDVADLLNQQDQQIAELEQENESYQKLINDLCNKHRVGSLKDLDEIYQATNESLYASRERLEELKSAKWELEEQLKKHLESNNDFLKQIIELEAQLIKERLKGEKK